jgi:DNA helicase-2/ATP-dependent DNA helicase PcrA
MVVGDDAQSIYAFRGADFDNILTFPDRHPDCTVFRLETNYRSTPPILTFTNASIANNQRQFRKQLRSVRSGGERPVEVVTATPEHQAEWIADTILELGEEGVDLEEIAVLYRNHSHSFDLQVELTRRNLPFRIRSGLRFFEQRHIKDVLAHLRFVDNPRDEVSFARALRLRQGFGPRLTARVWSHVAGRNPLKRLLDTDPAAVDLTSSARRSLADAKRLLGALTDSDHLGRPGEAVRLVVTEFYNDWARANLENAGSRLEDIEQLALFADGFPDLDAFLAEITLLNDLSGEDTVGGPTDEVLTLSTIHQAKGLEWQAVFVIWLSEGRFPTARAEDVEEERRLFYVASTRARERLFLVRPELARDRYRVDVLLNPSRFLTELPDDVRDRLVVTLPQETSEPDALSGGGRYQLPGFVDDRDDDVN